jgi:PKHD-type hydroxylase
MIYNTPYWYWENVLEDEWINKLHKLAKKTILKKGRVGPKLDVNKNIRNSNIAFFDERWIHTKLHHFVTKANQQAGWNFEWFRTEDVQYTEYLLNQFYDYHQDCHVVPTSNNRQRKLSVIVSLNDSSEYKGGEFKIMLSPKEIVEVPALRKKGSVVVFPSNLWHKVEPVTKGKRYSLVAWAEGFSFK